MYKKEIISFIHETNKLAGKFKCTIYWQQRDANPQPLSS